MESAMKWSSELPKTTGYFWYKPTPEVKKRLHTMHHLDVYRTLLPVVCRVLWDDHGKRFVVNFSATRLDVKAMGGYWAGPLLEPELFAESTEALA